MSCQLRRTRPPANASPMPNLRRPARCAYCVSCDRSLAIYADSPVHSVPSGQGRLACSRQLPGSRQEPTRTTRTRASRSSKFQGVATRRPGTQWGSRPCRGGERGITPQHHPAQGLESLSRGRARGAWRLLCEQRTCKARAPERTANSSHASCRLFPPADTLAPLAAAAAPPPKHGGAMAAAAGKLGGCGGAPPPATLFAAAIHALARISSVTSKRMRAASDAHVSPRVTSTVGQLAPTRSVGYAPELSSVRRRLARGPAVASCPNGSARAGRAGVG